jgi:hypothetical protein
LATKEIRHKEFFSPLVDNKVRKVIDIWLKPNGGGFAKKKDLPYFLSAIGNIEYQHMAECAPAPELFNGIKSGEITWTQFKKGYLNLIKERDMPSQLKKRASRMSVFCAMKQTRINVTGESLPSILENIFR